MGKVGRWQCQKAFDVFDDMRAAGLKPDVITYNSLITSSQHARKVSSGRRRFDVFEDMRAAGVKPNIITHNSLI